MSLDRSYGSRYEITVDSDNGLNAGVNVLLARSNQMDSIKYDWACNKQGISAQNTYAKKAAIFLAIVYDKHNIL